MESLIYFDNSATTKPCPKCVEYTQKALSRFWGNPSSTYSLGLQAASVLESARQAAADFLSCSPSEVFFTSCGSESNNTALRGAARMMKKQGRRIVTTALEHPSVLKTVEDLERDGFEVIRLVPVNGMICEEDLRTAITRDTILVSMMAVNNETGAVFDLKAARKAINDAHSPALLHCDAVQAFGKIPLSVEESGIDLLSASGHKIHAAKGIGLLYRSGRLKGFPPLITGGGQESGLRSGTEAVPAIAGLLGALESLDISRDLAAVKKVRDYAAEKLCSSGMICLNSPENALPYILNLSVCYYKSESVLNALSARGICVSMGSACAKGHRSYVLQHYGLSNERIDSALRLSFSPENTIEQIDVLAEALNDITKRMRRFA